MGIQRRQCLHTGDTRKQADETYANKGPTMSRHFNINALTSSTVTRRDASSQFILRKPFWGSATARYFTGQMPILMPNQQHQSTERPNITHMHFKYKHQETGIIPGPADDNDIVFVRARWCTVVSAGTITLALLPLLAASTEIPLSDSVGLDESLDALCSKLLEIIRPRLGTDDEARLTLPASGTAAVESSEPGTDE